MGFVSRNEKTQQIIKLAILMQNSYRGLSIKDIAEIFECSTRTAERMKALLVDLFPDKIEEIPTNEKMKRWRFRKKGINFLINFSHNDSILLENLINQVDTNNLQQYREIVDKIKVLSSDKDITINKNNITSVMEAEGYLIRNKIADNNAHYLKLIREAILTSNKIEFSYGTNSTNISQIKVIPYGIKISDKYFLVAYNDEIKGIRQFAFDKITHLKILDEHFKKDLDFDLTKYDSKNSNSNYKKIVLEFDKIEKEYVSDFTFGLKQKIKTLENGKTKVTFYSEINEEICLELVKWSSNLRIIEPVELKNKYKIFLEKILKNM